MEKKEIRNEIIKNLNMISNEDRDKISKIIIEKLVNTDKWKNAETIATTMAMAHEINTNYLIQACWDANKTVVVPKCNHKTKEMQFYKINTYLDLEKGYFGILEPKEMNCEKIGRDYIDLIIVPGVAFTINGDRLGYGGGYYDRYLEGFHKGLAALAYDMQIIDYIPTENHDITMPLIITESKIIQPNQ